MLAKWIHKYFQRSRIYIYKKLSTCAQVHGKAQIAQPVLFLGEGNIYFGNNVALGYYPSPQFYNGAIHLEARKASAKIQFGDNIYVNNNFIAVAESSTISIGNNVLIGTDVTLIDSDFHGIHPEERNAGLHQSAPITIGNNVFIGSNVKITKGVNIGENSIIAIGAVVSRSFPANAIIGGNPAQLIRYINEQDRTSKSTPTA